MSDFLAGAQVGFGIQDRIFRKKQQLAAAIKEQETDKIEAALREQAQKNSDRDFALREKGINARIDDAAAGREAAGFAAEQQENVDFARMDPLQQQAYLAGNAPVGIGVVSPDKRDARMRRYVDRMAIVNQSIANETESAKNRELARIADALGRAGGGTTAPSATVQLGPDGSMQRQWVRGVSPFQPSSVRAGLTQVQMPSQQQPGQAPGVAQQVGGGAPEISSQEEFDRLPAGAPFVFRGQRGVKKQ